MQTPGADDTAEVVDYPPGETSEQPPPMTRHVHDFEDPCGTGCPAFVYPPGHHPWSYKGRLQDLELHSVSVVGDPPHPSWKVENVATPEQRAHTIQASADGKTWKPAEPIGWLEEHSLTSRVIFFLTGRGHCGKRPWQW